ncbi:MAG TPA: hypothetical protein VJO12_04570 [Stellaceae bacterium]|nr:hypothetical protein [Stellaceae bacterium]
MTGGRVLLDRLYDAGSAMAWFAGAVFGLVVLYVLVNVAINGPKLRAAAQAALAEEIDQESDTFCRKYGIAPRTEVYQNCKLDLNEIRRRESERWAREANFD